MPRARTALASETALIFSRDRRVRFSASAKPVKCVNCSVRLWTVFMLDVRSPARSRQFAGRGAPEKRPFVIVSATLSAACRTFSACSRSLRAAARRCSASARLDLRLRLLDALDDSLGFLIAERLQDCGKELLLLVANMLLKRAKEIECG